MSMEWKPIKTAPKSQLVMVYSPPQNGDYPDSIRIDFDIIDPNEGDCWFYHSERY